MSETVSPFATADGGVLVIGSGKSGVLGTGATANIGDGPNETSAVVPIVFGTTDLAVAVASPKFAFSGTHVCAVFANGGLRCWGRNEEGRLGVGSTIHIGDHANEMTALPFIEFGTTDTASQVTVGFYSTCALFCNGGVRCWGAGRGTPLATRQTR
eukprot:TRINITY_DN12845_c0_g1_i4.p1 TRINITY_DN12845_c0_g1~~TRINITY_DN12845_c0_g1_i4.p1  ORF type:complete len:156 (+),score=23.36 TRINITY_DN12845_c0_g1_i4:165-632(+)